MFKKQYLALPLMLALALNGLTLASPQATEAAPSTVVYNLFATDTFVKLADGTQIYNYGFVGGREGKPLTFQKSVTNGGGNATLAGGPPAPTGGPITDAERPLFGNAQFPAPLIYATRGDVVELHLKNLGVQNEEAPNDPHSIHLHGLDVNAANDGVPETSVGAVPANLGTPGAGNVIVYMFSPKFPGTYMYHCHQEADIHVQMGMYGALVVYNKDDAAAKKGPTTGSGNLWGWKYDKDVILMLTEVDVDQHHSEEVSLEPAFNPINYHPQFWFINGLSFPNTIHADGGSGFKWVNWINAHPGYDPFIVGHVDNTSVATTPGDKILLRVINMGFETQPMHMHGFHGKILGADQREWPWAQPGQPDSNGAGTPGAGLEKNTLTIGSGETYEWLLDFGVWTSNVSTYPAGTQTRYTTGGVPVANTNTGEPVIPIPDGLGATYIGGPTVSGVFGNPPTPLQGQLFPFHNHDDYKATNNGAYPGGMFTMIETIP